MTATSVPPAKVTGAGYVVQEGTFTLASDNDRVGLAPIGVGPAP